MCTRQSRVLYPLEEEHGKPKGTAILCNSNMELAFYDIKRMFSISTLLNYISLKILITLHIYDYDKQLGAVFSQNYNPISFF